jgi:hypothetical protein
MRTINSIRPRTATTHRAGGPFVASNDVAARRPSPRHIADAVTAGYIRDISQPTRRSSGRRDGRRLVAKAV